MKDFKKNKKTPPALPRRPMGLPASSGGSSGLCAGWLTSPVLRIFRYLNPLSIHQEVRLVHYQEVSWATYFFSIALIISISIVFDFNENLAKFTEYHAPAKAIIFDYYANFIPYFANLFSALFVFVAVILFTSKLAGNSEIIAILASGVSFKRLLRPYLITCIMLSALTYRSFSLRRFPHGHRSVTPELRRRCTRTRRRIPVPKIYSCR